MYKFVILNLIIKIKIIFLGQPGSPGSPGSPGLPGN